MSGERDAAAAIRHRIRAHQAALRLARELTPHSDLARQGLALAIRDTEARLAEARIVLAIVEGLDP